MYYGFYHRIAIDYRDSEGLPDGELYVFDRKKDLEEWIVCKSAKRAQMSSEEARNVVVHDPNFAGFCYAAGLNRTVLNFIKYKGFNC